MNINPEIKNIIAIDDEKLILDSLQIALKFTDYNLSTFLSAETALDYLNTAQELPDLIITDYKLLGMTGLDFILEMRKKINYINLILITGYGDKNLEIESFRAGADDFLYKPITIEKLLNSINKIENKRKKQIELFQKELDELDAFFQQQLKEKTEKLIQAEKFAELASFTAKIIHDLNNYLVIVQGNTKLIELFFKTIKKNLINSKIINQEKILEKISNKFDEFDSIVKDSSNSIEMMNKLIQELRAYYYTNSTKVKYEEIDLSKLFEEIIKIINKTNSKKINIITQFSPEKIIVTSDKDGLRKVFINLLQNACHAVENTQSPTIIINVQKLAKELIINIKDNGTGIEDEIIDKIWEPFFTTKPVDKATGLGLTIVRDIIQKNNGTISVTSKKNIETCFTVKFPV